MIEHIIFGWSLGGLSMLLIQQAYDSYHSWRTDLRDAARCKCIRGEE